MSRSCPQFFTAASKTCAGVGSALWFDEREASLPRKRATVVVERRGSESEEEGKEGGGEGERAYREGEELDFGVFVLKSLSHSSHCILCAVIAERYAVCESHIVHSE
eukprot:1461776-Rhodomonas_salina.1